MIWINAVATAALDGQRSKGRCTFNRRYPDVPFGRVVQTLHFRRHMLSSTLLWFPLPEGWEMNPIPPSDASAALTVPSELLQHRALLT
jgi:hypothetical protein